MKISLINKIKGFTLVETFVVVFIFSIIMLGTTAMIRNIFLTSTQQALALDSVDQARIVLTNFANEVRNAANANNGAYPLNRADDSELIFFSTYGASGSNINRIHYYLSNNNLYKGVIIPTGSPATYNLSSESSIQVLKNISATGPLFSYYDESYAGTSTPLTQPININQINFVQINLTIFKQDVRNSTSTFSLSVGATLRNLKTNLAN